MPLDGTYNLPYFFGSAIVADTVTNVSCTLALEVGLYLMMNTDGTLALECAQTSVYRGSPSKRPWALNWDV